jgi:hypothetical protein
MEMPPRDAISDPLLPSLIITEYGMVAEFRIFFTNIILYYRIFKIAPP